MDFVYERAKIPMAKIKFEKVKVCMIVVCNPYEGEVKKSDPSGTI